MFWDFLAQAIQTDTVHQRKHIPTLDELSGTAMPSTDFKVPNSPLKSALSIMAETCRYVNRHYNNSIDDSRSSSQRHARERSSIGCAQNSSTSVNDVSFYFKYDDMYLSSIIVNVDGVKILAYRVKPNDIDFDFHSHELEDYITKAADRLNKIAREETLARTIRDEGEKSRQQAKMASLANRFDAKIMTGDQ